MKLTITSGSVVGTCENCGEGMCGGFDYDAVYFEVECMGCGHSEKFCSEGWEVDYFPLPAEPGDDE